MDIENAKNLGKHWAAIRGNKAIAVIPMLVPSDVDFEAFRIQAINTLQLLGEVKTGELLDDYGDRYFIPRKNHGNRSKNPKPVKPIEVFQPSDTYQTGGNI